MMTVLYLLVIPGRRAAADPESSNEFLAWLDSGFGASRRPGMTLKRKDTPQ